jgi:trimethylamine--corrinoid protein Co-methyltransferase
MQNRIEILSNEEIFKIHNTSMSILNNIGIHFSDNDTVQVFRKNGHKVENNLVYFSDDQVINAIKSVPKHFKLHARNSDNNIEIGNGKPVFAPGYGAPFLIDHNYGKRIPSMTDYHNLVSLSHALPNQDLSGFLIVEPGDVAPQKAHLHMLFANILHSDKPFLGSTDGKSGANDTLEIMKILYGQDLYHAVVIGLINPISPLSYSKEMCQALNIYANAGQPAIIASLVMAGSTGPITLAGVLAQQNAEIMAGIVYTQLVNPGTPVLYGSSSTNIEMKTGMLAIGSPELSMLIKAHAQLARFYKIPSRAGGALTDSCTVDAQASFESMFSLMNTVSSGVDFVLHSAGILSSFLAFSYEKFVIDDEMCGIIRHVQKGFPVNEDTLAYDVIANVGPGGNYLTENHTVERCRSEYWQPDISNRSGLEAWMRSGQPDVMVHARERVQKLLAEHSDPHLDRIIKRQLNNFFDTRV